MVKLKSGVEIIGYFDRCTIYTISHSDISLSLRTNYEIRWQRLFFPYLSLGNLRWYVISFLIKSFQSKCCTGTC